jgi:hypothetical protein
LVGGKESALIDRTAHHAPVVPSAQNGATRDRQGWASRELEVSGADVVGVLPWAAEHAEDDKTYTFIASLRARMALVSFG